MGNLHQRKPAQVWAFLISGFSGLLSALFLHSSMMVIQRHVKTVVIDSHMVRWQLHSHCRCNLGVLCPVCKVEFGHQSQVVLPLMQVQLPGASCFHFYCALWIWVSCFFHWQYHCIKKNKWWRRRKRKVRCLHNHSWPIGPGKVMDKVIK